ncbi:MAG: PatB family C-S lyase, partial [Pseudomonadota bacterium]
KTAPVIIAAMQRELEHGVFGYSAPLPGLVEITVDYLAARYGWQIEPDWLVWFPGVVPGMAACCRISGEPGDEVIAMPPVYHYIMSVAESANRRRVDARLREVDGRWTLDFGAIEASIGPRTRVMLLCHPHNPVGTVFTPDELRRLAELCAERDVLLVSDEIHCDLILDRDVRHTPAALASPGTQDNIVTLMAPSKTFNLAGNNCSFAVISDPELRSRYHAAIDANMPLVGSLGFAAARAAYGEAAAWHTALLDYLRGNRDLLQSEIDTIPGLSMGHLSATYLAWVDVNQLQTDDAHALFLQHGLGFSNGAQFGDGNYQRINFACTRANLVEAIRRIKNAVGVV